MVTTLRTRVLFITMCYQIDAWKKQMIKSEFLNISYHNYSILYIEKHTLLIYNGPLSSGHSAECRNRSPLRSRQRWQLCWAAPFALNTHPDPLEEATRFHFAVLTGGLQGAAEPEEIQNTLGRSSQPVEVNFSWSTIFM